MATIDKLHIDPEANEIMNKASQRNRRYGSGDTTELCLYVIDETRKAERRKSTEQRTRARANRSGR